MPLNEYVTWSVALQALQKNRAIKPRKGLDKFAFKIDGKPMTFAKWNSLGDLSFLQDTIFDDYKKIDLGGGDQKKLFYDKPEEVAKAEEEGSAAAEAAAEKKGKLMEKIRKLYNQNEVVPPGLKDLSVNALDRYLVAKEYSKLKGVLFTAGDNEERKQNIENIRKKISEILSAHESPVLNTGIYALNIDMETKLTALSYYDKAKDLLEKNPTYKKLVLIPIGSTDLHIITYNKDGGNVVVDCTNYANFGKLGKGEKPKNWKDPLAKTDTTEPIDSYWDSPGQATSEPDTTEPDTIVVFAGSSTYYFGDFIKDNGDKNIMTIQDIIDAINSGAIQNSKRKDLLKFLNICEDKAAQFMFMSGGREANVAAISRDTINVVFPIMTTRETIASFLPSSRRSAAASTSAALAADATPAAGGGRSRRRRSRRNKKKTKRRAKNNKKRKKSRRRKIRKTRVKHKK